MSNDLISREALIKALNEAQVEFDEYYKGLGKAKVITDNAPTVADRPQGEWKLDSLGAYCSECGTHPDYSSNFCPNCGAKMKGGAE